METLNRDDARKLAAHMRHSQLTADLVNPPGYKCRVIFTKHMRMGALKGMQIPASVPFVCFIDAQDWVDRVRQNCGSYDITDVTFQQVQP